MRKAAPKETPKPCNKPKMPPGGHRKPPWTEAVAVRRDRLAAGRVAHETKEFLKVLEAMAEKGYDVSVVPKNPGVFGSTDRFRSLADVMHRAKDLNAAAERLLVEVLEFGGEDGQFYTAAETIAQMTEGLVDDVEKKREPYVKKREKEEAKAKKRREKMKAERDKAAAEAAAEEAAAIREDEELAAALSDEEEEQDDEEDEDEDHEKEDSDDEFQQDDDDEDDDDDDEDDDDAPPPAAGGAAHKKKRGRPATSDEEDEAPAPAPAPGRARKPAAKKSKKPAAAAAMDVEEAVAPNDVDLTADKVEKLKVSELRSALEARGLPTDGLKKVLKERLLAAITTSMDEGDEDSVPEVPGTTI